MHSSFFFNLYFYVFEGASFLLSNYKAFPGTAAFVFKCCAAVLRIKAFMKSLKLKSICHPFCVQKQATSGPRLVLKQHMKLCFLRTTPNCY